MSATFCVWTDARRAGPKSAYWRIAAITETGHVNFRVSQKVLSLDDAAAWAIVLGAEVAANHVTDGQRVALLTSTELSTMPSVQHKLWRTRALLKGHELAVVVVERALNAAAWLTFDANRKQSLDNERKFLEQREDAPSEQLVAAARRAAAIPEEPAA